jgi:hypothetical protein
MLTSYLSRTMSRLDVTGTTYAAFVLYLSTKMLRQVKRHGR